MGGGVTSSIGGRGIGVWWPGQCRRPKRGWGVVQEARWVDAGSLGGQEAVREGACSLEGAHNDTVPLLKDMFKNERSKVRVGIH